MTANTISHQNKSPRYNLGDLETFNIYVGSRWRFQKNMNSVVIVNRTMDLSTYEITLRTYTWETEKFDDVNGDAFVDAVSSGKLVKI